MQQVGLSTLENFPFLTMLAVRSAVAAIYYDGADENSIPFSSSSIDPQRLLPCSGEPLQQLIPDHVIPANPQGSLMTVEMNVNFTQIRDGAGAITNQWTINDMPYHANLSRALLSKAQAGILDPPADYL